MKNELQISKCPLVLYPKPPVRTIQSVEMFVPWIKIDNPNTKLVGCL